MPRTERARVTADEDDWQQIPDQVLRKRTQNRLAQRKHRRIVGEKLKILEQLTEGQDQPQLLPLWPYGPDLNPQDPYRPSSGRQQENPLSSFALSSHTSAATTPQVGSAASRTSQRYDSSGVANEILYMEQLSPQPLRWPDGSRQDGRNGSKSLEPAASDQMGQSMFYAPSTTKGTSQSYHPEPYSGMSHLGQFSGQMVNLFAAASPSIVDSGLSRDSALQFGTSAHGARFGPSMETVHQGSSTGTPLSNNEIPSKSSSPVNSSPSLGARIESAVEAIRGFGFDSIDELAARYYTADLQYQPMLLHIRQLSRRRGLTDMLRCIREDARDNWTDQEIQRYRDEILRAAEETLSDEFSQFTKLYGDSGKSNGTLAERKRLFQEELPNLSGLLSVLGFSARPQGNGDHAAATVYAISVLLHGSGCLESIA